MKTLFKASIISSILLVNCLVLNAQTKHLKNYRPYSEFASDSIAYLKANFGAGGYFKEPISYFLDDLQVPIKLVEITFLANSNNEIANIFLYVSTLQQIKDSKDTCMPLIGITLSQEIKPTNTELYQKFAQGHTSKFFRPWSKEFEQLIRNMQADQIYFFQPIKRF